MSIRYQKEPWHNLHITILTAILGAGERTLEFLTPAINASTENYLISPYTVSGPSKPHGNIYLQECKDMQSTRAQKQRLVSWPITLMSTHYPRGSWHTHNAEKGWPSVIVSRKGRRSQNFHRRNVNSVFYTYCLQHNSFFNR